jgi:hypothetical protein
MLFLNKIVHIGRINHILHSGIYSEFFQSSNFKFLKFEKTSSMELVLQIDSLYNHPPKYLATTWFSHLCIFISYRIKPVSDIESIKFITYFIFLNIMNQKDP